MKRIIAGLLCAAVLLGSLTGCGAETSSAYVPTGDGLTPDGVDVIGETQPQERDGFSMAYYQEEGFNPFTCINYTNRALFCLLYQGLFTVNSSYEAKPILCRRYTVSESMRYYVFYLDENATFSDGTKVTSEDVLASYDAARESSVYKGRFTHLREITILEDGGIQFWMDTPYENLPILLDVPIVKASQIDARTPVGSGPYCVSSGLKTEMLAKVPNWWCSAALPLSTSSIPLENVHSATEIRDGFEFGNIGVVCADPGASSYADYRCDFEVWECDSGVFLYLVSNDKSEVFGKKRLCAELTYAIDRDAIVDAYYHGFAHPATLPASPLSPYYDTGLASNYYFDSEKFEQAVADNLLYEKKVVLLVNSGDTVRLKVARDIVRMLRDCGLDAQLRTARGDTYYYLMTTDEYDLYLGQTKMSANMDLSAFYYPVGALSYASLEDDAIYDMALQSLENNGNYYNLHKLVTEEGQLVPILFQNYAVYAKRGLLTGMDPARDNMFYYDLGRGVEDALFTPEAQ